MDRTLVTAIALALSLGVASGLHAQAVPAGDSLELKVDGMVCSLCAYGVERRLKMIDAVERVHVNLDSGVVALVLRPGAGVSDSTLAREVRRAGFALRGVTRFERADPAREPGGPR